MSYWPSDYSYFETMRENEMTAPNAKPRAGEHTPGKWIVKRSPGNVATENTIYRNGDTIGGTLDPIADVHTNANARRIVACVNALEGVSLEALENVEREGSVMAALVCERDNLKYSNDALAAQNRELVEALKRIDAMCDRTNGLALSRAIRILARAVLTKVRHE